MTMNINDSYRFYMGAYAEKTAKPLSVPQPTDPKPADLKLTDQQKKDLQDAFNAAAAEYRLFGEDYDYATISEEGRGFTVSDEVRDMGELISLTDAELLERSREMAAEANRQLQTEHLGEVDELLWGCSGNQWLLFSQMLYNNGYFDDMSADEAREIDRMLCSITSAMDGYRRLKNWGNTGTFAFDDAGMPSKTTRNDLNYYDISSYGMQFMLESSTAALQYFSENYIKDEDLRKEFQDLIDMYHTSNAQQIAGHHSWEEAMDNFRSKYLAYMGLNGKFDAELLEQERKDSAASGIVAPTEAETSDYLSQLSFLFSQMKDGVMDFNKIWGKISDTFADYASKGNQTHDRSLALDRAGDSLQEMRQIWANLLGAKASGSSLNVKA